MREESETVSDFFLDKSIIGLYIIIGNRFPITYG